MLQKFNENHRLNTLFIKGAAIAGSLVLLLYVIETGRDFSALGKASGTLGLAFIVVSLLLTLRIPSIAGALGGLEAMYRLHRMAGMTGYMLILAHPLLVATTGEWQALNPIGKSPGFLAGWVATILIMIVLLFTFVLKPRGYAIWRNIHWLAAPAFLLMGWHALHYATTSGWPLRLTLFALLAIGIVAMIVRSLVVDRGMRSASYTVARVERPIPDVVDVVLEPRGAALRVIPGQFIFSRFLAGPNYGGCAHFHPFTVSTVLEGDRLRLSIKALGPCTSMMQHLAPGAIARLQGPFGRLFQHIRKETQVWIAGGIGITPFLARARSIDPSGISVKLFYAYDSEDKAAFTAELREIASSKPNLEFYPTISHHRIEVVLSVFDAMLPPWDDKDYILCGPPGLITPIRAYLSRNRVHPDRIHEERFDFR